MHDFSKKDTLQLKGIAILMMILHHLFAYPNKIQSFFMIDTQSLWYQLARYGRICVPIFLIISGYGMYESYQKQQHVFSKIPTRLYALYQMYWKVFLIWIPMGFLIGAYSISQVGIKEILLNFLGLHSTLNEEWWFFYLYVLLILLSPVLIHLVKRCHYLITMALIVGYCYFVVYGIASIEMTSWYQTLLTLPLFGQSVWVLTWGISPYLIGCLLSKYHVFHSLSYIPKGVMACISICLCMMSVYFFLQGYDAPLWNGFHGLSVMLVSKYCVSYIPYGKDVLEHLGKHSNHMWLIHTFFIYYYFPKAAFMFSNAFLTWIWVTCLTLISSTLTEKIYEMIMNFVSSRKRMV